MTSTLTWRVGDQFSVVRGDRGDRRRARRTNAAQVVKLRARRPTGVVCVALIFGVGAASNAIRPISNGEKNTIRFQRVEISQPF